MLIDSPSIVAGSVIVNLTVPYGVIDPQGPNIGELFFRTDLGALRAYSAGSWNALSNAADLTTHVTNQTLHLTPAQSTLLSGLSSTLTASQLNFMSGVTSAVQTQLNAETQRAQAAESILSGTGTTLSTHISDMTMHLTAAQHTLLNGTTVLFTDLNSIPGIASTISTLGTNFNLHLTSATMHLSTAQSTYLGGLTLSGVGSISSTDVNRLTGLNSFLTTNNFSTIAAAFNTTTNNKVSRTGDTMTGTLAFTGATVTGLPTPVNSSDAVNKAYVDMFVNGLKWAKSVRAVSTANLTLSGLQTVDGVSLVSGDYVLVKNQSTTALNGIYTVSASTWSRADDYNTVSSINNSAVFSLAGGTLNSVYGAAWIQTNIIVNLNTDAIAFSLFSGGVSTTAGSGIAVTGGVVSVLAGTGLTFSGSTLVASILAGGGLFTSNGQLAISDIGSAGTYRSVTTNSKGQVTAGLNPTTISGYGLTDAVSKLGDSITGNLAVTGNLSASGTLTQNGSNAWTQASLTNLSQLVNGPAFYTPAQAATAATASTLALRDSNAYLYTSALNQSSVNNEVLSISQVLVTNGTDNFLRKSSVAQLTSLIQSTATGSWSINITGSATSATSAGTAPWSGISSKPTRTTWVSTDAPAVVVGQLGWKNFGLNGTIFDASAGTAPTGTATSNANATNPWAVTYPTLMGFDGTSTYGVRVDSARLSDLTGQRTFSNVRTDGINRGSYGSISIAGSTSSWAGIDFTGASATFMVSTTDQTSGIYKTDNTWLWNFDSTGALSAGTIPGTKVTGTVAAATLATKSNTLMQNGGTGAAMTFNWAGQTGQPTWLWGSTDGINNFVYNPSNFSVSYAATAGNSTTTSQTAFSALSVQSTNNTSFAGASSGLQPSASTTSVGSSISFYRPNVFGLNMGLDSDNVFRIGGWSAAASRLQMDMSGNLTMAGDITAFSDRRLKTDITLIPNALDKVMTLNGVLFSREGKAGTGLIAQEVQAVLPEAVMEHGDDKILSVAYGNLVGVLVEAIKDLNSQVQELKAQAALRK